MHLASIRDSVTTILVVVKVYYSTILNVYFKVGPHSWDISIRSCLGARILLFVE